MKCVSCQVVRRELDNACGSTLPSEAQRDEHKFHWHIKTLAFCVDFTFVLCSETSFSQFWKIISASSYDSDMIYSKIGF
jgi:hypothetical protein